MKTIYILLLPIVAILVWLGLNYRQLHSVLTIRGETSRLEKMASNDPEEYRKPESLEGKFDGELSPHFWNFSIINGGGKVSHDDAWHSTVMTLHDGLTIHHVPDLEFKFDMFGFSVAGKESSIQGVNGALCYLALNWMPVQVNALSVDIYTWHEYEIRLRWISKTEWEGSVHVDGVPMCEMSVPAFGPVEVHVWSDNSLVLHRPRRWWEISSSMDMKFQDDGEKQFQMRNIQISAETR